MSRTNAAPPRRQGDRVRRTPTASFHEPEGRPFESVWENHKINNLGTRRSTAVEFPPNPGGIGRRVNCRSYSARLDMNLKIESDRLEGARALAHVQAPAGRRAAEHTPVRDTVDSATISDLSAKVAGA